MKRSLSYTNIIIFMIIQLCFLPNYIKTIPQKSPTSTNTSSTLSKPQSSIIKNTPQSNQPAQMISLFLKPYPDINKINHHTQHNFNDENLEETMGIYASYYGSLATSDENGQISFSKKHASDTISLIIANYAQPIFMIGNTIHHWEVNKKYGYEVYRITQQKDHVSHIPFWSIKKQTELPNIFTIPIDGIMIYADGKDVIVPTGIITLKSAEIGHLILPSIFVKKTIQNPKNTIGALQFKQFFRSIEKNLQQKSTTSQIHELKSE